MTELIRYDLYNGGNKHEGGGVLASLYDTGIYNNYELYDALYEVLDVINYKLPVPDYYELGKDNVAFFTPEGYEVFGEYMERLAELIERQNNGWKAVQRREVLREDYVIYQDDYQIILRMER